MVSCTRIVPALSTTKSRQIFTRMARTSFEFEIGTESHWGRTLLLDPVLSLCTPDGRVTVTSDAEFSLFFLTFFHSSFLSFHSYFCWFNKLLCHRFFLWCVACDWRRVFDCVQENLIWKNSRIGCPGETDVTRHNGRPIKGPHKTPQYNTLL